MDQINSTINILVSKYKKRFKFIQSSTFRWSPSENAIYYKKSPYSINDQACFMHEIGHALLNHQEYNQDISLLRLERDAWNKALEIARFHSLQIPSDVIEQQLDTYREWLHMRSRCPACNGAGTQKHATDIYGCLACSTTWRVNDARYCALRRYSTTQ